MAIKIRQNGQIKDLIIPACGVEVLDMEGRFNSKNLEDVLKEIGSSTETNMTRIENKVEQLSNPNLLINGDFQVWQRGTSFSGNINNKYAADRWHCRNSTINGTITINKDDNGCKLNINNYESDKVIGIYQYLETDLSKKLIGTTVTLTVDIANITGDWKAAFQMKESPHNTYGSIQNLKVGKNIVTGTIAALQNLALYIRGYSNGSITIKSVKLELGSIATPYSPRPYAEELALCQRYYQKVYVSQSVRTSDYNQFVIEETLNTPMRTDATVTYGDTMYLHNALTGQETVTLCSNVNSPEIPINLSMSGKMKDGTLGLVFAPNIQEGTLWSVNRDSGAGNRISGRSYFILDAEIY